MGRPSWRHCQTQEVRTCSDVVRVWAIRVTCRSERQDPEHPALGTSREEGSSLSQTTRVHDARFSHSSSPSWPVIRPAIFLVATADLQLGALAKRYSEFVIDRATRIGAIGMFMCRDSRLLSPVRPFSLFLNFPARWLYRPVQSCERAADAASSVTSSLREPICSPCAEKRAEETTKRPREIQRITMVPVVTNRGDVISVRCTKRPCGPAFSAIVPCRVAG